MKKSQPKFKSLIAWQIDQEQRHEFDPGRDDEGDRRLKVYVADDEAVFADAERRVKILVSRMEDAFLRDDTAKVKSCASAIAIIGRNHRPKGWKGLAVRWTKEYMLPGYLKELMEHSSAIGKGDRPARAAALTTVADFAAEIAK